MAISEDKIYEDNYIFSRDEQADKLDLAKNEGKFDKNFLRTTIDVIDNMSEGERIDEYKKFLKNPYSYISNFDTSEWEQDDKSEESEESKEDAERTDLFHLYND